MNVFTIYCSIYTFYSRALKSFPLIMVLSKMLVIVMKHALQYVNELQPLLKYLIINLIPKRTHKKVVISVNSKLLQSSKQLVSQFLNFTIQQGIVQLNVHYAIQWIPNSKTSSSCGRGSLSNIDTPPHPFTTQR